MHSISYFDISNEANSDFSININFPINSSMGTVIRKPIFGIELKITSMKKQLNSLTNRCNTRYFIPSISCSFTQR